MSCIARDQLAKKFRQNWLNKFSDVRFINFFDKENDDSLTNLNWLPNLNLSKLTSSTLPLSPIPTDLAGDSGFHEITCSLDQLDENSRAFYKNNTAGKPPFSYFSLACMAIQDLGQSRVTFTQICEWIIINFPYYQLVDVGWQNSIKNLLAASKCFQKVPRRKDEPEKGGFWRISSEYQRYLSQYTTRQSNNYIPSASALLSVNSLSSCANSKLNVSNNKFSKSSINNHTNNNLSYNAQYQIPNKFSPSFNPGYMTNFTINPLQNGNTTSNYYNTDTSDNKMLISPVLSNSLSSSSSSTSINFPNSTDMLYSQSYYPVSTNRKYPSNINGICGVQQSFYNNANNHHNLTYQGETYNNNDNFNNRHYNHHSHHHHNYQNQFNHQNYYINHMKKHKIRSYNSISSSSSSLQNSLSSSSSSITANYPHYHTHHQTNNTNAYSDYLSSKNQFCSPKPYYINPLAMSTPLNSRISIPKSLPTFYPKNTSSLSQNSSSQIPNNTSSSFLSTPNSTSLHKLTATSTTSTNQMIFQTTNLNSNLYNTNNFKSNSYVSSYSTNTSPLFDNPTSNYYQNSNYSPYIPNLLHNLQVKEELIDKSDYYSPNPTNSIKSNTNKLIIKKESLSENNTPIKTNSPNLGLSLSTEQLSSSIENELINCPIKEEMKIMNETNWWSVNTMMDDIPCINSKSNNDNVIYSSNTTHFNHENSIAHNHLLNTNVHKNSNSDFNTTNNSILNDTLSINDICEKTEPTFVSSPFLEMENDQQWVDEDLNLEELDSILGLS